MSLKGPLLIAAMLAYDLFIVWMAGFMIAWGGADAVFSLRIETALFWLLMATALAVTAYCVSKLRALSRGEDPRI